MPQKDRYMLIDGNALLHRAFHALPTFTTTKGEPTGAVYGFTAILLKAIKDIKPTHIACTFDLEGPTFRHKQYKEYKATRVKADQSLYDQIPRVKEVVKALNIPIFEKKGYEADDILGTLSQEIKNQKSKIKNWNGEIIIVTGDLDTLQLVDAHTKVYTLRKGLTDTVVYDEKAIRDRYGLKPEQMVDFKALKGDSSDNIPGVSGIGEKGAIELIRHFHSIDNLYEELHRAAKKAGAKFPISNFQFADSFQISNFKSRILNLLINQEAQARMSYELSLINRHVPLKTEVAKYQFSEADRQRAFKVFQALEFKSLLGKLPSLDKSNESEKLDGTESKNGNTTTHARLSNIGTLDYELVDTEKKLEKMLKALSSAEEISVDTETTSLNPIEARLAGIGLSAKPGKAYYVPADWVLTSPELKQLLANRRIKKIGHNLKYDMQVLHPLFIILQPLSFDTMIASYLLDPGTRQHNLEALAFSELGYQMQPISELIGKGRDTVTMDRVPPEKVAWYCGEDVDITLRLKQIFEPELKKQGLEKVFTEIEMPLVEVLAEMEMHGIKLDEKVLNRLAGEVEVKIKELEHKVHKLTNSKVNINSPKQLKELLFEKLRLPPPEGARRTKTGLSTAADELEKMKSLHPVIPEILEYRELSKVYSTYLITLPKLVNPKTGRLHTSYNQTVAATGRLSSTEPNLQNIPVRGEGVGSEVRKAFVAEKGYKLLSLDYSQIELRIVAHLAQDEKMMGVFKRNEDIHTQTAMAIFGVSADQVTKDMRRDAKTINFGILYGLSSFGLSSRIGEISRVEAKEFITKYFAAYPAVEHYIEQIKLQVKKAGFVRNELGRIRRFPEIKSGQWQARAAAERAAVNFPIQSLAADVIKVAMINIYKELRQNPRGKEEIKMLLQVHDELVFEVQEDKVEHWAKKLIPLMENAIKLSVPVKVEAKVGENWGEMEVLNF